MEDSSERQNLLTQDTEMDKDYEERKKQREEGSWTPTRSRRGRKKKRDQEKQKEALSPYQFSVQYLDPVSGKKDTLAEATLSPLVEQSRMTRDAPTPARQRRLYADLRESEGEIIAEGKKQKRRRKRTKGKGLKREQSKDDLESLFKAPELSPTRLSEISEIPVEESIVEDEYLCLVARTALILPFSWKVGPTNPSRSVVQWIHKLRETKYTDTEGHSLYVWESKDRLPSEVMDFTPQFRQVVGWRESQRDKASYQTWTCQRLICNPLLVQSLFSTARLCTIQDEHNVNYEAEIEGVELLVYPMGTAILVYHVNWLPSNRKPDKFTLDDARSVLFASKFRHKVQGLCMGWNFYDESSEYKYLQGESEHCNHLKCLGSDILQAKYNPDKTVSMTTIGNWLLHLSDEDPNTPVTLLDYTRHAYHHTTIVLNREPPSETLQEYLYHLRRAFGQKNRPPPNPEASLGSILTQRLNRYTGISREGTVCVSWPIDLEDPNDFELTKWHKKFQGVYLILALHVHGERCVLFELGDLAAGEAENLRLVTTETSNFNEMKQYRQRLRELAALMVRYTLSMSSNDCGGSSEFTEFFTTLRKVFGIPELRAELSSELKDVLAVVESNYLEEERRQRDEAEADRRKNREFQAEHKALREQHEQQFNLILGILGSFTLPFVVVSGVFGMNLHNLPENVDFWWLIVITMIASILLLVGIIYWRKESKRKWQQSMLEIKSKLNNRSENDLVLAM